MARERESRCGVEVVTRGSSRSAVVPAKGLLPRLRLHFLLLTGVVVLVGLIDLLRLDAGVSQTRYVAALVGYGLWAATLYRTRGRYWWLDPAGPALVFAIGYAAGNYDWAFSALYSAVFLHLLFVGRARALVVMPCYLLAYEAAVIATVDVAAVFPGVVSHGIGLAVVGYLVHTIATVVGQHDRSRERERVVRDAGARLAASTEPGQVAMHALEGVVAVVAPTHPNHRVTLWRQEGRLLERFGLAGAALEHQRLALDDLPDALVADYLAGDVLEVVPEQMEALQNRLGLPPEFDHGLVVPLNSGDGLGGLVFVATKMPIESDLVSLLELFAHQVALADVLARRNTLLSGVVNNSADSIVLVGRDEQIVFASPSVEQLTGRDPEALTGHHLGGLLLRQGPTGPVPVRDLRDALKAAHHLCAVGPQNQLRQVEVSARILNDNEAVLNLRDVTDRRRLEEEIAYRAFHDPVTGLANRALFNDRLDHALARVDRDHARIAVALIDLDDFKSVNDVLGHTVGDQMLVEAARRLREELRRGDTAARFGGDEFAVLMEDVDAEEAVDIMTRVVSALREPLVLGGQRVTASGSIGVRAITAPEEMELLVRDADVAMYAAKADGKNRVVLFEDGMRERALARIELRSALTEALERECVTVHYQPIVSLRTGRLHGFEALARWQHPKLGMVPPDVFIPIAEESGLIVPLGRAVLQQACQQLAHWLADDLVPPDTQMAVNLSVHQLLTAGLIDDVVDTLRRTGLPASSLTLEVTESTLMSEADRAAEVLAGLQQLGVHVAIDDFGTGYSSFSYLQRLPVDVIKIDRSFVAGVTGGPERSALAKAIVTLAATLNIVTVAEGVEHGSQADKLDQWGCAYGQGWLWAKAMPAHDVAHWLQRQPLMGKAASAIHRSSHMTSTSGNVRPSGSSSA